MMQLIRDKAQGIFVWLIVAFIIITFATFGLSSYLSGSANVSVAVVNGQEILATEYDRAYQNFQQRLQQQQGANYRPDMFPESFVRQQVIDSLVTDLIFEQYLQDQDYSASATQVQSQLIKQSVFNGDNKKFSKARYREVLDQQSINVVSYENSIKKQIIQQQLYKGIQGSSFVLDAEVKQYEKLKNQQRDIGELRLSLAKFKNEVKISDDEIETYYKTHTSEYMTPEMVSVEYVELDLEKIAQNFTVADEEAKNYYSNNIKLYSTGNEQRKIRHILINVNKKTDDETAKKQITALYDKIIAGAEFTEIAKKSSQDPGSSKQGGDLGLSSKGDNDKSFDEVAFSLKKNEVSKPVRSRFGYHLIKVDDIKSAKVTDFAEVKDKIKTELKKNKSEDGFYKDVDRMDQLAYESSGSLGPMKDELNLELKTSSLFSRSGGGGIFSDRRILDQIFSDDVLNQGRNSAPVELSESHYVVVRLAKKESAKQKPLETVKSAIKSRLLTDKANTLITKSATDAAAKLSKGIVGDKIVSEVQYTKWTRYGNINRNKTTANDKDSIDPVIRKKAFNMPRPATTPTIETMTLTGGDKAVIVVFAVKEAATTKNTKPELNNEVRGLTAANSNTELDAFIGFIKEQADIKIIKKTLDQ
ncbi:MAG: SurA N-terminal domain-containing protein [Gammaproteobacteria bacterium]